MSIEGDINGIFFPGTIEAEFEKANKPIDKFTILIGNDLNSQIVFHNIRVKIDNDDYKILTQELKAAKSSFKQTEKQGEQEKKNRLIQILKVNLIQLQKHT